jgi:hypothetical protein
VMRIANIGRVKILIKTLMDNAKIIPPQTKGELLNSSVVSNLLRNGTL